MAPINPNPTISSKLNKDPLTPQQWDYVEKASQFVDRELQKDGPSILQRFQAFAAMPANTRYVNAIIGQKHVNRAGPEQRGYSGDAIESIDDHQSNMMYMGLALLKKQDIADIVYRDGRDPIKERGLFVRLTREHDCTESMMFDMSKTDAEKLPKGMKQQLEDLSIKVIFQEQAVERRRMEKYADKSSTVDRFVKVMDAMESVADAIAGNMSPKHFNEFLGTARKIVDEYASPEMKVAFAGKMVQGFKDYYDAGDLSRHENLSGRNRRRAIIDAVISPVVNNHEPIAPRVAPKVGKLSLVS